MLNATIGRYAWGSFAPREGDRIHIESADLGISLSYAVDSEVVFDGHLDLAKAAFQRLGTNNSHGFGVFLRSDAPPGPGLGSSSALMVGLVGLVKEFKNRSFTDYEVARLAYVIEREDLGIRGGLQDQYAAGFGGFNFIEFGKDKAIVNPLRIPQKVINELEDNLILCFTSTTRRSHHIIEDQSRRYEENEQASVAALRPQKHLALEMKNALLQRQLDDFGSLLHCAWESKKHFSPRISNPAVDELYEQARKEGALRGKMTGAGGDGYMLFYCIFEKRHKVEAVLRKMGASPTRFAFDSIGLQTWRVHENFVGR